MWRFKFPGWNCSLNHPKKPPQSVSLLALSESGLPTNRVRCAIRSMYLESMADPISPLFDAMHSWDAEVGVHRRVHGWVDVILVFAHWRHEVLFFHPLRFLTVWIQTSCTPGLARSSIYCESSTLIHRAPPLLEDRRDLEEVQDYVGAIGTLETVPLSNQVILGNHSISSHLSDARIGFDGDGKRQTMCGTRVFATHICMGFC